VVNAQNSEEIIKSIKRYRISKVARVVFGGRRRQDSVGNGLKVLGYGSELVLIHDSARPFIDRRMIQETIRKAEKCGAAIVGVPVKATIKKVTKTLRGCYRVKETIDRSNLWEIQTPQVFEKDLILKAYKKFGNIDVTDDAMLAEKLGAKVSVVFGSYDNIKITTPQDLVTAQAIAKKIR